MLQIKNILFARDFSPCSDQAIPYALDLAVRTGATLHTLYAEVLHGDPFNPPAEPATSKDKIRARLKAFAGKEALKREGYDPESVRFRHAVVRGIAAAPALLGYAGENDIDVIVMGTHGRRGARHLLLGSVAEEVVRLASCPVLTVRKQDTPPVERERIRTLLMPVDFSEHVQSALRYAKELASLFEARLTLLHVVEEPLHPAFYFGAGISSIYDVDPNIEARAVEEMKKLYQETEGPGGEVRFEARPGRAAHEIAAYAEGEGIGLIVMPTHGRTGLAHLTMGSVAEKVVRLAACPVLTLKSFGKPPARAAEGAAPSAKADGDR